MKASLQEGKPGVGLKGIQTTSDDQGSLSIRSGKSAISMLKDLSKVNQEFSLVEDIGIKSPFAEIVGQSATLRQVLQLVELVATTEATVLLLGETGAGKELIARAIYQRSQRRKQAFVTINCAAIPGSLFESELFGHERGA